AAAHRGWLLLAGRARDGWGWNFLQPADADSTLWALRLADRLGVLDSERARAGLRFLQRHIHADGLSTYVADHHRTWSNGAVVNPGWFEVHDCVTAAAAGFPQIGNVPLGALRARQRDDGSWRSYWWQSPAYATAHAADALSQHGAPDDRARIARAVAWARR